MGILLLTIIVLSSINTGYMFWIIFGFNGKLVDGNGALPIRNFISEGGLTHLGIILVIAIVVLVLFIIYAIKDSGEILLYNDGYK